jgi:hypothetical protein
MSPNSVLIISAITIPNENKRLNFQTFIADNLDQIKVKNAEQVTL